MEVRQATPAELADIDRRSAAKYQGPQIKKWERNMTLEQYLQAVQEGRSRADIVLKHFNNDSAELRKQLNDWEITESEAVAVSQTEVKKEDYLKLRLNGEKRVQALKTLGLPGAKGYLMLNKWCIREIDAEERELELFASANPASAVNVRVAEQIEQKAEEREQSVFTKKEPAGAGILQRMEERAAAQEQKLLELQETVTMWERSAEEKNAEIANLHEELAKAQSAFKVLENEKKQAAVVDHDTIRALEKEKALLTHAIKQDVTGMVAIRLPILAATIANVERTRIYDAVERLSTEAEPADIDRERVMSELFDLLQRVVNFVVADLAELHPGKDVSGYVREFFAHYNERHLRILDEIRKAG
jgi:uncharacterized coiled-coil protein SlyX